MTKETWTVVENGIETLLGYVPTYLPSVPTAADARRVTVGVGQEVPGNRPQSDSRSRRQGPAARPTGRGARSLMSIPSKKSGAGIRIFPGRSKRASRRGRLVHHRKCPAGGLQPHGGAP